MDQRKKYELLTNDTKTDASGRTLYRIRALRTIGLTAAGSLGGYIQSEANLSQVSGDAWVYGNAQVSGDAWVYGNAQVSGDAWVYGNARVSGDAWVYGNAQVSGDAWVYGNARVSGDAWVYGNARVYGNAQVSPLHIQGLTWDATITDDKMTIGCQTHSLEAWEQFTDREIAAMDGRNALSFWRSHKDQLLGLARATGRLKTKGGIEA